MDGSNTNTYISMIGGSTPPPLQACSSPVEAWMMNMMHCSQIRLDKMEAQMHALSKDVERIRTLFEGLYYRQGGGGDKR
jgi:hypothetical protein